MTSRAPMTWIEAVSRMQRSRSGRPKLQNNTYLEARGDDYAVVLHDTDVVTINEDDTFTLDTGGWNTVTTKDRINSWSPARVFSVDGVLCVMDRNAPTTEPKIRKCRTCRGTGTLPALDPPVERHPASTSECYWCEGTGQCDYGSKPRHWIFYDGIRVDTEGRVIDPAAKRYPESQAEREARELALKKATRASERELRRAQREVREGFFKGCQRGPRPGEAIVFKAVNPNWYSDHGAFYTPGATTVAADWTPLDVCGAGLHFSATPAQAAAYMRQPGQAVWFACAVKIKDSIVIGGLGGDKIKAPSCRVLWEVDSRGIRLS